MHRSVLLMRNSCECSWMAIMGNKSRSSSDQWLQPTVLFTSNVIDGSVTVHVPLTLFLRKVNQESLRALLKNVTSDFKISIIQRERFKNIVSSSNSLFSLFKLLYSCYLFLLPDIQNDPLKIGDIWLDESIKVAYVMAYWQKMGGIC